MTPPQVGGPDERVATAGDVRRLWEQLNTLTNMLHERFVTVGDLDKVAQANEIRFKAIEEWLQWAQRLVLGTVILAVIGLVITGGISK